jgi:hypothetical protein
MNKFVIFQTLHVERVRLGHMKRSTHLPNHLQPFDDFFRLKDFRLECEGTTPDTLINVNLTSFSTLLKLFDPKQVFRQNSTLF